MSETTAPPGPTTGGICPEDPTTWPASARAYWVQQQGDPDVVEPTSLAGEIAARIRARGPISFAAFMKRALYDPRQGYYRTVARALGPQGDFVTAPETHPAFGRIVGARVRAIRQAMGEPHPFTVAEMGAGRGRLARGVLEELRGNAPWPIDYLIIEPAALWRREQCRALAEYADHIQWVRSLRSLPDGAVTGVLLANELLDAFPVHRVIYEGGRLRELWVHLEGDRFVERPGLLTTRAIERYFARLGYLPSPGRIVEVNLAMLDWLRSVRRVLARGHILIFDYGGAAEDLFGAARGGSTLRAYRGQQLQADPLAAVGRQDLTADVDFTTLTRTAEALGFCVAAYTSQRAFLLAHGWEDWRRRWSRRGPSDPGFDSLLALVDPRRMGQMRVLELSLG
ncbi:MAG: SAM-dependent methyltransferase [Armatimonadetes bacterium]|nr:SAM-dependent methyltransferase [Armatimonadota bacterium]